MRSFERREVHERRRNQRADVALRLGELGAPVDERGVDIVRGERVRAFTNSFTFGTKEP